MKTRISSIHVIPLCFLLIFLLCGGKTTFAKEIKEHPLIRPFPGSVLAKNMSNYQKFNAYDFYYMNKETNKREKKQVKGEYYHLLYEVRTPSGERVRDISSLEFYENYKAAALEKGGEVVYDDPLVFTIPRDDGGLTWCKVSVSANLGQQYVIIIDEKGFKKSMTFGPKELKDALDKDGKVLLYGILFDVDKASLKPESVAQLQHIVSLMTTYQDLNLEIQGHTDNQGSDAYNKELSEKRAQTVCTYIELFGIHTDRLLAAGYGETRPVASNDTEEGRAKNRRVELVKMKAGHNRADRSSTPQGGPGPAATTAQLEGKWAMAANKRVTQGVITFYSNSTYLMEERLHDGTGVSHKGEFKINSQASPSRLDLCLQKCGIPGSEYTTGFSIFRFHPDGKLEIRSSPDGKYPAAFNDGPADDYTMILTRVE